MFCCEIVNFHNQNFKSKFHKFTILFFNSAQDWSNTICGLHIITNVQTHGMFHPDIPCPSEYSVTVPDGVEFSDFLVDDIIAKPSNADFNYWITGFKSQISLLPTVWATYGTKNLVDIGYKNQD